MVFYILLYVDYINYTFCSKFGEMLSIWTGWFAIKMKLEHVGTLQPL